MEGVHDTFFNDIVLHNQSYLKKKTFESILRKSLGLCMGPCMTSISTMKKKTGKRFIFYVWK